MKNEKDVIGRPSQTRIGIPFGAGFWVQCVYHFHHGALFFPQHSLITVAGVYWLLHTLCVILLITSHPSSSSQRESSIMGLAWFNFKFCVIVKLHSHFTHLPTKANKELEVLFISELLILYHTFCCVSIPFFKFFQTTFWNLIIFFKRLFDYVSYYTT